MRRFLLISPYFPPLGVIGVKRALSWVRHLPAHGWQAVVLAAPVARGPVDEALARLVPATTPVAQAFRGEASSFGDLLGEVGAEIAERWRGSWQPRPEPTNTTDLGRSSYLTPLDRYAWDVPAALAAARRLVREHRPDAIVVNADPWSGLVVGALLARRTGLPLVADLRDPWSLHAGKMALRPPLTRAAIRRIEAWVFRSATRVVLNSQAALDAYRAAYADALPAERFSCIRNAFDRALLGLEGVPPGGCAPHRPAGATPEQFILAYFGQFRRLVPAEPLLEGVAHFVRDAQPTPERFQLRVIGGHVDPALPSSLGIEQYVERWPRVGLADGARMLEQASALALVADGRYPLVLPGKLYDYLAVGRPILAVSSHPEVDAIVRDTGAGLASPLADVEATGRALASLYRGTDLPLRDAAAVARYGVEHQALLMARELEAAASSS